MKQKYIPNIFFQIVYLMTSDITIWLITVTFPVSFMNMKVYTTVYCEKMACTFIPDQYKMLLTRTMG